MIFVLVCERFRYTVDEYMAAWAKQLDTKVEIITYETMAHRRMWRPGTYLFTDIERLIRAEKRAACRLAERLAIHPDRFRVLNDPRNVLMRFELLKELHRVGANAFNVHRVGTPMDAIRFPVFLKRDYEHSAKGVKLLHSPDELRRALKWLGPKDLLRKRGLMITEYCDVSDEQGQFRKLSAMRLGERLIPRHILLSKRWLTKKPDLINPDLCAEEAAFVAQGDIHQGVMDAFEIAGIDYGRVDYGLLDNKVQIWEINTNPRLVPPPERIDPQRHAAQAHSAEQINAALTALCEAQASDGLAIDAGTLRVWKDPLRQALYRLYAKYLRR